MASGDRRLGVRRGMTVLGKIPAVPKPINLPSQRLENRGLDPSVEIVPRGTFNWGSGRSPPTTGSSWVSAGLSSSSPPVGSGAWSTPATNSPAPSSINSSGTENQSRPMSAGNARPSSAGASRPLSASTTGRAWGNAMKLEEQSQPSRFNLTNADFPTLGSEKELNWQPLQHATTSNRPTSADATKERQLIYASHYKSGDRPTSADATKERKPVYPGTPHVDRPISADGTHPDKGIQQPASRLPSHPPVADSTMPDQRRLFNPGLSRHGIAGPGPGPGHGTHDGPKENVTRYPVPVQQTITVPSKEFLFPGVSLHDVHFNRPGGTHANDVVVLPVDGGPEVYGSYAFDMSPTNQSTTSIDHHPRATWGPHYLERSMHPEGRFVQPGPAEPFHVMNPSNHRMETAVLDEPAVGNKRDGFAIVEEHRSGWAGPNVVYISSPVDARESLTAGSQKFVRPEMFLSSWGRQPMPTGWSNVHGGSLTVGTYQEMPSSVNHQHAPLIDGMGSAVEVITENVKNSEKQVTCSDEVEHSIALRGQQAAAPGNDHKHGRKDAQGPKHKETLKISTAITLNTVPDILRGANHVETIGGTLPIKTTQEDKETKAEQNKESLLYGARPKMASQSQENTNDEDFQGFRQDRFTVKDSNNVLHEDKKSILKRKNLGLQNSSKATKETDPLGQDEEKGISILKASKENSLSSSILSSSDLITTAGTEIKNDSKDACPEGSSKASENPTLKSSAKESKRSSASNFVASVEEEKIPLDDGSKTKRNVHSVRRAHGRSIHEPHSVDRQHVNHGMVWTPKPVSGGIARDEVEVSTGDDSDLPKSFSTDGKKRETQPLGEHEAHGEIHAQQMPLAANNQQGQADQGQELSAGSNRRPSQPVQQHRSDHSHKKQGPKVQQMQYILPEQSMQYEELTPLTSKKESSYIKSQESSSNIKFQPSQSQVSQREANRRESQAKQFTEDGEQVGAGIIIPVLAKPESKNHSGVYSQKTSRNQHRHQQHEQEHETIRHDHVQRFFSKEEKPGAEDIENPAREAAILSAFELKKSRKDVKSNISRNGKQRKGDPSESGADTDLEGHLFRGDKYQREAGGERPGLSLPVEVKGPKDKEEKAQNQKVLRKHEMQTKQSATVSRQEYRYVGEDPMADTLNSEPIAKAEKRYVPKQITKQYLQQELEAPGMHGPARQRQAIQEPSLPTDKVKDDYGGPQSSPQSLGTHTTAKKRDMVRYTPLPARKKPIEEQQYMAASQSGHESVDLNEVQPGGASFSHADSDIACTAESADKGFDLQSSVMEHRDSNKVRESFEPFQSKKDAKHYVAKSSCKQESPPNFDAEALLKGTKLQRSHCVSTSDSAKRKEGVKPYGAKDDLAKQKVFSAGSERKTTKETGAPPVPEQNDLVGNQKQEKSTGSDHFYKNHSIKAAKSTSLNRSSQKNLPPSEYRNNSPPVNEGIIHDLRVEETNDSTKDYKQDDDSSSSQKIDSRQGSIEVGENPSHDDVDMAKPRQNQRRRYQYQPVVQHLQIGKPQVAASSTYRSNNRPTEQGHSRYERAEGPRRGQGQAYYYRATEHTNNV